MASQVASVVKNLFANAGDIRDLSSISGLERDPEEGNDNPLQYSCLENTMDRVTWWGMALGVAESSMTEETYYSCKNSSKRYYCTK